MNTKTTTNFEDLDIINPKDYNLDQVQELKAKTDEELKALYKQETKLNREIRGTLWLWWFLPIFGWIIYSTLLNNKKQKPKWIDKQVLLKREIAKKEIQNIFNKKRIDELTKPVPTMAKNK